MSNLTGNIASKQTIDASVKVDVAATPNITVRTIATTAVILNASNTSSCGS